MVPSPLAGEGQGEGSQQIPSARLVADLIHATSRTASGSIGGERRALNPPPPVSLPRKGGGNAVAQLGPSPRIHSRVCSKLCACQRRCVKMARSRARVSEHDGDLPTITRSHISHPRCPRRR